MAYQYVVGVNLVRERRAHLSAVVAQVEGDVCRAFWHWHEKDVFETLVEFFRLWVSLPLLEEGGERVAIYHLARGVVAHCYLSIALHGQFAQALTLAIPAWRLAKLIYGDMLLVVVAREDVVQAEGLVLEPVVKVLRVDTQACEREGNAEKNFFHCYLTLSCCPATMESSGLMWFIL